MDSNMNSKKDNNPNTNLNNKVYNCLPKKWYKLQVCEHKQVRKCSFHHTYKHHLQLELVLYCFYLFAPCSGLGVLKRNPDSKWKLQPEFIDNIKKVQEEVLHNYSKIVKPGGKMVYATCSILPSENEEQIKKFLKTEEGQKFKLIKDQKVLAHQSGFDGFYMALMEKKS